MFDKEHLSLIPFVSPSLFLPTFFFKLSALNHLFFPTVPLPPPPPPLGCPVTFKISISYSKTTFTTTTTSIWTTHMVLFCVLPSSDVTFPPSCHFSVYWLNCWMQRRSRHSIVRFFLSYKNKVGVKTTYQRTFSDRICDLIHNYAKVTSAQGSLFGLEAEMKISPRHVVLHTDACFSLQHNANKSWMQMSKEDTCFYTRTTIQVNFKICMNTSWSLWRGAWKPVGGEILNILKAVKMKYYFYSSRNKN